MNGMVANWLGKHHASYYLEQATPDLSLKVLKSLHDFFVAPAKPCTCR